MFLACDIIGTNGFFSSVLRVIVNVDTILKDYACLSKKIVKVLVNI